MVAACDNPADGGDRVAGTSAAINSGSLDDGEPPRFGSVVELTTGVLGEGCLCTGTLISPYQVLTSAHCVINSVCGHALVKFGLHPTNFTCARRPCSTESEGEVAVAECRIHPEMWTDAGGPFDCFTQSGDFFTSFDRSFSSDHDVAVLTLRRPVLPTWTTATGSFVGPVPPRNPHRLPNLGEEPAGGWIGQPVSLVGYGTIGSRTAPDARRQSGFRRFVDASITGVAGNVRSASLVFVEVPGHPFAGARAGDSGGPIIWSTDPTSDWREPAVLGTDVERPYTRVFTFGGEQSNLEWVRSVLDPDADGRGAVPPGYPAWSTDYSPTTDVDGDLTSEADDNCPGLFNVTQNDIDGDGFGDECDSCVHGSNVDTDGDGLGDGCDNCVDVPNADQADADSDFIGDLCDVCPLIGDPAQPNCNADAEEAAGLSPLGDACDPQPCAETRPLAAPGDPRLPERFINTNTLRVDGLASAPLDARGSHRWCTCSAATDNTIEARRDCRTLLADDSGACIAGLTRPYRTLDPLVRGAWQMPATDPRHFGGEAVTPLPVAVPPLFGALPDEFVIPYNIDLLTFSGATNYTHLFTPDTLVYWDTAFDAERYGLSGPFGRQLRGVLQTHTAGPPEPALGYYDTAIPTELNRTAPLAALTSNYWAGTIELPAAVRLPFPCMPPALPLLAWGPGFPLAGSLGGSAWLLRDGVRSGGGCRYDVLRDLLPFADNRIFARPAEIAPGIGPELFAVEGKWIAASEPARWLPATGVRYAAFDLSTQLLTRTLAADSKGTISVVPPPVVCPPNGCGELPPIPGELPLLGALDLGAAAATESARTDALLVLSARRATLYYGGGVTADGRYPGDLIAYDLRTERSRPLALSEGTSLGRVLAATYSPADDALYVLDEPAPERRSRRHGRPSTIRFLRIAQGGDRVDLLFELPRVLGSSRFALAPAPDGTLYLAASNEAEHVVVRLLLINDDVRAIGFAAGRGALAPGQARAHEAGLTVLTVDRLDRPLAVEYGARSLGTATRGWERRCF